MIGVATHRGATRAAPGQPHRPIGGVADRLGPGQKCGDPSKIPNDSQRTGRIGDEAGPMPFTPIVGTLAYLWDHPSDRVLLIRRNARPDDDHYGKVNGLGGKVEPDESVVAGVRRELDEEAGVELTELTLRGTITWTNFGQRGEEWLGFVFLVTGWRGTPPATNDEGTLEWVARRDLLRACGADDEEAANQFPMWPGDRHFVPLVFDDDPRTFHGTMPYDGDRPRSWTYERI